MDYNANSNVNVSATIFLTDSTEDPEASAQRQENNRGRASTSLYLNKWETVATVSAPVPQSMWVSRTL